MAGTLKSGSVKIPSALKKKRIGIVVAEWNDDVTEALYQAAEECLLSHGLTKKQIIRKNVPGSFELSLGSLWLAQDKSIHGVIAIGCVIQGETPHFDYICQAVANGVTQAGLMTRKPVIFGVLTTLDKKQALDRAGGKYGNKGEEAALSLLSMLTWKQD